MNTTKPLPLPDYEARDASPRAIILVGGLLAVGIAAVLESSALIYRAAYTGKPVARTDRFEAAFSHGPESRTDISRDWEAQDRAVHEHLATYGWIDRGTGVVRVPIERAMDLIAAEGGPRSAKDERR